MVTRARRDGVKERSEAPGDDNEEVGALSVRRGKSNDRGSRAGRMLDDGTGGVGTASTSSSQHCFYGRPPLSAALLQRTKLTAAAAAH